MPLLFEETPGAEGGSTPQPQAAGIKAVFSPLQGKNTQTPDFSWAPRKESVTSFVPRPSPRNLGGRPRKRRTDEQKGIAPCTGFYSAVLLFLNFKTCTDNVYQRAWDTLGFKYSKDPASQDPTFAAGAALPARKKKRIVPGSSSL